MSYRNEEGKEYANKQRRVHSLDQKDMNWQFLGI